MRQSKNCLQSSELNVFADSDGQKGEESTYADFRPQVVWHRVLEIVSPYKVRKFGMQVIERKLTMSFYRHYFLTHFNWTTTILFISCDLSDQGCVFGTLFSLENYVSDFQSTANFSWITLFSNISGPSSQSRAITEMHSDALPHVEHFFSHQRSSASIQ